MNAISTACARRGCRSEAAQIADAETNRFQTRLSFQDWHLFRWAASTNNVRFGSLADIRQTRLECPVRGGKQTSEHAIISAFPYSREIPKSCAAYRSRRTENGRFPYKPKELGNHSRSAALQRTVDQRLHTSDRAERKSASFTPRSPIACARPSNGECGVSPRETTRRGARASPSRSDSPPRWRARRRANPARQSFPAAARAKGPPCRATLPSDLRYVPCRRE